MAGRDVINHSTFGTDSGWLTVFMTVTIPEMTKVARMQDPANATRNQPKLGSSPARRPAIAIPVKYAHATPSRR